MSSSWHSHVPKILFRLYFYPYGSQPVGAFPPATSSGKELHGYIYPLLASPSIHQIHFTGHFLSWHRSYVHRFERALREECGFRGTQPYWDWTKGLLLLWETPTCPRVLIIPIPDVTNFSTSPFFDPDPKSGLGGWGDPQDDYQITTGGFAFDFERPYPAPHRIRRKIGRAHV